MGSVQCWISPCNVGSSIHVRLTRLKPVALPTASFRFHLAMDTLAVQLEVSTATPSRVSHPLAMNHASHIFKSGRVSADPPCQNQFMTLEISTSLAQKEIPFLNILLFQLLFSCVSFFPPICCNAESAILFRFSSSSAALNCNFQFLGW